MSAKFSAPLGGARKIERLRAFVQAEAFRSKINGILSDDEYDQFVRATNSNSRVIGLLSEVNSQQFRYNPLSGRFNWANIAEWIVLNNLEIFAFVLKVPVDKWAVPADN